MQKRDLQPSSRRARICIALRRLEADLNANHKRHSTHGLIALDLLPKFPSSDALINENIGFQDFFPRHFRRLNSCWQSQAEAIDENLLVLRRTSYASRGERFAILGR
jgi:hypothetical protein